MIFIFLIFIFVVAVVTLLGLAVKNPNNTIVTFAFYWQYRALYKFRSIYLQGQRMTPPSCFDFFYGQIIDLLDGQMARHPYSERRQLAEMMSQEEFVRYYFDEDIQFNGIIYNSMVCDYRSGAYMNNIYDADKQLRQHLSTKITSSKAFEDFKRLAEEGWFARNTGLPNIEEGNKNKKFNYQIGRAIYWICERNGIGNPSHVFAEVWPYEEKTIREWIKGSKNEEITKAVDDEILAILDSKK